MLCCTQKNRLNKKNNILALINYTPEEIRATICISRCLYGPRHEKACPELSLGFWKQEFRTPIWQKGGVPLEKVGVPLQKSWSSTNLCILYIFSILAGSDTFE